MKSTYIFSYTKKNGKYIDLRSSVLQFQDIVIYLLVVALGDLEIKVGLLLKVSCPDYVPLCLNEFLLKWKKNEEEEEE